MVAPIASLRVDSPGVVVVELGLWLILGLYCFMAGVADLRRRRLPWRLWGDRPPRADQWQRRLRSWSVIGPNDTDTDLPGIVGQAWALATSYQAIVYGLANCLAVLCCLLVGLVRQHLAPLSNSVFFFGLMLSFVGGNLGGHLVGVARLRARPGQTLSSYGDPRPRRLRDYRSPAFFVCGLTFAALQAALTLLAVRPLTAIWSIYPLLSFAVVLGAELLLYLVTQAPRLPLLSDPARARRLDDMLRSQTFKMIQGSGLYSVGFLGLLQGIFLSQTSGMNGWVIAMYGTSFVCYGLGVITLQYLDGWMGGTVTGWRWEKGSGHHGPAASRP